MEDLVSIIMPSFNSEKTITDSISSVLSQSYENWELLITDDMSTDGTKSIIEFFSAKDHRIKPFFNEKNLGAGCSRNNSITKSNGRYIAFLDSDDLWRNDKLEKQISFMKKNNYVLTYSEYKKINNDGDVFAHIVPPERVNYNELLKSNVIGCLTAIYDAEILGKVLMPSIRKRQDMALWLTILERIDFAYCISEPLAFYREGNASLSSNKMKILFTQWSFYRHYLKFSILKSAYYFSHYAIRAVKKHGVKK